MGRQTLGAKVDILSMEVATVKERVDNLIENNKSSHKEIMTKMDSLCNRVNHQFTILEERTLRLEKKQIEETSKYKAKVEVYKWTVGLLSVGLTLIGILRGMGVL